jgi:integrase
LLGTALGLQ